jgi:hypothetical protein
MSFGFKELLDSTAQFVRPDIITIEKGKTNIVFYDLRKTANEPLFARTNQYYPPNPGEKIKPTERFMLLGVCLGAEDTSKYPENFDKRLLPVIVSKKTARKLAELWAAEPTESDIKLETQFYVPFGSVVPGKQAGQAIIVRTGEGKNSTEYNVSLAPLPRVFNPEAIAPFTGDLVQLAKEMEEDSYRQVLANKHDADESTEQPGATPSSVFDV